MADASVVIVGTGFGCHTHLRAIRGAGLTVSALVGRDPERTRVRAERFGVPLATTSLSEALEDAAVVAVAVVTPPNTHRDLVLEAVGAGKHVVCEKPFARDVTEAREMRDAAELAGSCTSSAPSSGSGPARRCRTASSPPARSASLASRRS